MWKIKNVMVGLFSLLLAGLLNSNGSLLAEERTSQPGSELTFRQVRLAMQAGLGFLVNRQLRDGSFPADEVLTHPVGVTCLATLALQELPLDAATGARERALQYLKGLAWKELPIHELSFLALVAVRTIKTEKTNGENAGWAGELVQHLVSLQQANGGWWRGAVDSEDGLRISSVVVLALQEASEAGYSVPRETWERALDYWQNSQNAEGSWGTPVKDPDNLTGRMSLVGRTRQSLSMLSRCQQMLRRDSRRNQPEWACCLEQAENSASQRGMNWLNQELADWKPQEQSQSFLQYHLYALQTTGGQGGVLFSGEQDWYRSGTHAILLQQDRKTGAWPGNNRVLGTSYALLFLSQAVKPVLAQKWLPVVRESAESSTSAVAGPPQTSQDLSQLTNWLSTLPGWPRRLNCQEIQLHHQSFDRGVAQLLQAPVLYVTGDRALEASEHEVLMLQSYLQQGGVLIGAPRCQSAEFERSFQELVHRIEPSGGSLRRLPQAHPVYWMEFALPAEPLELWGLESGCRTAIFYAATDLSCVWNDAPLFVKTVEALSDRQASSEIPPAQAELSLALGANLIAYATAKQVVNRFDLPQRSPQSQEQRERLRGLFEVVELQTSAGTSQKMSVLGLETSLEPSQALLNMLQAARQTAGIQATAYPRQLILSEEQIFQFPMIYCHGDHDLQLSLQEKQQLKLYLQRGGVLFADACCGSPVFDRSFRNLMQELFPKEKLAPLPISNELFSSEMGHDLRQVDFRLWSYQEDEKRVVTRVEKRAPVIEVLEIAGRSAVVYSPSDLSCALEDVSLVACEGYTSESAAKIVTNLLIFSLLQ